MKEHQDSERTPGGLRPTLGLSSRDGVAPMSYAPGSRFPKSLVALEAPEDVVTMDDIITSGEVTPAVLQSLKTRQGPPASTPPLAR